MATICKSMAVKIHIAEIIYDRKGNFALPLFIITIYLMRRRSINSRGALVGIN